MSHNLCSMTHKPLLNPVVSRLTGHLYEKDEIQKHLQSFPYCPVTNKPMQLQDLIRIPQTNLHIAKPNQSMRLFMTKVQSQYDTLVLESHYLRQSLKETKQQLMHTMYQNQAAQRLIGKLLKEKAETQATIAELKEQK